MKTKPTKFKSAKQFIELWQAFCDDIVETGFSTIPSQTSFCKWLAKNYESADRKTIYNSLNKIFPTIKNDFEKMQSDIIVEGSMLGKYQPTMSIFALKNWCSWTDKQEVTQATTIDATDNFIEALSGTAADDWSDEDAETNNSDIPI